jgi:hypothetical protein
MRWAGIKNGELLDRAAREFQVLLTIDQSIEHQQSLPSGLSMIVLLLPDNKPDTVLAVAEEVLSQIGNIQPGAILRIQSPIDPSRPRGR